MATATAVVSALPRGARKRSPTAMQAAATSASAAQVLRAEVHERVARRRGGDPNAARPGLQGAPVRQRRAGLDAPRPVGRQLEERGPGGQGPDRGAPVADGRTGRGRRGREAAVVRGDDLEPVDAAARPGIPFDRHEPRVGEAAHRIVHADPGGGGEPDGESDVREQERGDVRREDDAQSCHEASHGRAADRGRPTGGSPGARAPPSRTNPCRTSGRPACRPRSALPPPRGRGPPPRAP